jgi:hypothetical protein
VERPEEAGEPRVVVLGDSFMEGYGVADGQRMSDVLETATGIPHLNFGTSGNAGSTHAFALYQGLASKFRHDAVLCAILPENDFDDDLPSAGRYLPYWEGEAAPFELRFPIASHEDSRFGRRTTGGEGADLGHVLREFTYTQNVIDLVYSAYKQGRARGKTRADDPDSRFFRFSELELARLQHSFAEIARLAAPRPVVLFTIPRLTDFAAAATLEQGLTPLDEALSIWARGIDNLFFVPLLPEMLRRHGEDPVELFLPCDPHWNADGHRAASLILSGAIGDRLYVRGR